VSDARPLPPELAGALDRLSQLVGVFEEHPDPEVRDAVVELLRAVDAVHRRPLAALVALLRRAGVGDQASADPQVALLLDLYDLAEDGERGRADGVLDAVRPYIESHGGRLEVLDASNGVVTVRLSGACAGCRGSTATLRHVVEDALRTALDDFVRLDVVEPAAPVLEVIAPRAPQLTWRPVGTRADVGVGTVRQVNAVGAPILLADVDGELYGFMSSCPENGLPLDVGDVEGDVLVCPWHGCRYTLRGGGRLDGDGPGLDPVPVAVDDGAISVGVLAAA
jgi:Fe-S cluster biogenesis protein NfuA/nitrite reductase/ring-hydroxylating ferredoxin subunit